MFCFQGIKEELFGEGFIGVRQIGILGKVTADDIVKLSSDQSRSLFSFTFNGIKHEWSSSDARGIGTLMLNYEGKIFLGTYARYNGEDAAVVYAKAFAVNDENWNSCSSELAVIFKGQNSDGSSFLKKGSNGNF